MAYVKKVDLQLETIPDELCRSQSIYINVGDLNLSNNLFEEIPETIQLFRSLKKLSFASNRLRNLSDYMFALTGLEGVVVNQNKIHELNPLLTKLTKLTSFEICANQLTSFPISINVQKLDISANLFTTLSFKGTSLTFLDVSQNDLTTFPNINCPNLKQLNISYNDITHIPDTISNFPLLRNCDFSRNKISALPGNFSLLTGLTYLDIQNNPISTAPPNFSYMRIRKLNASNTNQFSFEPMQSLKELHYRSASSNTLVDSFSTLNDLETFDISFNNFTKIPNIPNKLIILNVAFNQLSNLTIPEKCTVQKVFARHNRLSTIDSSITQSSRIVCCDFSNNELYTLPNKIAMTKLDFFSVAYNNLYSLDMDYLKITSLTHFDASFNKLSSLPSGMTYLVNLKSLYLAGNRLTQIPVEYSNLMKLEKLHLSNNSFAVFPPVIPLLTSLKKLYISSNQIDTIPSLSDLVELHTFDASNCYITSATAICDLPKLEQLNLSNNYLSAYHSFSNCPSLIHVDISFNSVSRAIDPNVFKKLNYLDISFNDIANMPEHNPNQFIHCDGCLSLQRYPFLHLFDESLHFKAVPTKFATSQMCADRDEMQDSVFCIPHFAAPEHYLIAAVDGHSSYYVSYYFSQVFPKIFYDILQNKELVLTIEDAFREAFATIQQAILDTPNVSDGAVVTVIFLTPQTIYTAQCGDCRAIYLTEDEVIQLAPEHKTVDPIERKRIRSDGGYVDTANRVGGLLVARSVGDIKHKPIISEHPEVTKTERRSNERFLVVATDGLWDEVSNEMVFNILNQNKTVFRTSQLAALLRDTAYISCIANQHPDNIGIVLCRF